MDRMCWAASRLSGSLAVVLLTLAALAVPNQFAWADSGQCMSTCYSDCSSSCTSQCGNDPNCYQSCNASCTANCPGYCCFGQCQGSSSCQSSCCQSVCMGDTNCVNNCTSLQIKYKDHCPTPIANPCPAGFASSASCTGLACSNPNWACTCVFTEGDPNTCTCPP
jgi:hypothetical protein